MVHDVRFGIHSSLVTPGLQLDVTFPALACSIVSLDAMDISGEQHLDVVSSTFHCFTDGFAITSMKRKISIRGFKGASPNQNLV